MYQRQD